MNEINQCWVNVGGFKFIHDLFHLNIYDVCVYMDIGSFNRKKEYNGKRTNEQYLK